MGVGPAASVTGMLTCGEFGGPNLKVIVVGVPCAPLQYHPTVPDAVAPAATTSGS